jgi:hypothetical protein
MERLAMYEIPKTIIIAGAEWTAYNASNWQKA